MVYYMASVVQVINYHIIVFYENKDYLLVSCLWQQLLRNPGRHFGLKIIFAPPPILTVVALCCPFLGDDSVVVGLLLLPLCVDMRFTWFIDAFLCIIWASSRENLSSGFPTK